MSDRPTLDYATPAPPRDRRITPAEELAVFCTVATVLLAAFAPMLAPFVSPAGLAAGTWAAVQHRGRTVTGWVGVAVCGGVTAVAAAALPN